MKKLIALLIALCMLLSAAGATAGNDQVQGEIVIYSSMYQFVLDMLDEALREEFPNLKPGNNGSFFVYGGTSRLINQIYGEMEDGVLGCDMLLVAEPALSLELKEEAYLEPVAVPDAASLLRFPYDEEGYWYPVRVCNMVLAYNPELEAQWAEKGITVPKTFKDFASDRSLKGVIAMGDPLSSGTTFAAVASLTQSGHYGRQYLKGLAANEIQIISGSDSIAKVRRRHDPGGICAEGPEGRGGCRLSPDRSGLHLSGGRRDPDSLHRDDGIRRPQQKRQCRGLQSGGTVVPQ